VEEAPRQCKLAVLTNNNWRSTELIL